MWRVPDLELNPDHPDRVVLSAIADRLHIPAGDLTMAGSMPEFIEGALAVRPQLHDARQQQVLTDRFLTPRLDALKGLFLDLRAQLDPALRRAQPIRGAEAYPIGQCLEIARAVRARLETLDPAGLSGGAAEACAGLCDFRAAGGEVRLAWGVLRDEYFQNALIVGTLYVDVSNDAVVVTKPPVEILPFVDADFKPVADYTHFARIAAAYWKHRLLPNHLLPQLAPYFPLIQIGPNGAVRIGPPDPYMLGLTLVGGFAPSEGVLAASAMPAITFESLSAVLRGGPVAIAGSSEEGRDAALACCRAYRARSLSDCATSFNRAVMAARQVNRRLARLRAIPQAA